VRELEDGYTDLEKYLVELFDSMDLKNDNEIKDMMKPIFLDIISTIQDFTNDKMVNTYSQSIASANKKITMFRIIKDCKELIIAMKEIIFKSIFYILAEKSKIKTQNAAQTAAQDKPRTINNNKMTLLLEPFFRDELMSNNNVSKVTADDLNKIINRVVLTTKKINNITNSTNSIDLIDQFLNKLQSVNGIQIYTFPTDGTGQHGKSLFDYDSAKNNCPPITNNLFQEQVIVIATTVLERLKE
jgi:hypothetical protein